jgi:hypothetical protein
MNLVKWDPFKELEDVSTRLNRIFGRPLARSGSVGIFNSSMRYVFLRT